MSESRKAPCIDVRTDVHKDERFKALAELAGHANYYESLGRMHALWSWCRDRGLKDTREGLDGYVVHEAIVRRFVGPDGVTGILAIIDGEPIDDLALAVQLEDGMLYLRGTSEYVAAARAHALTSSAGGRARASQAGEHGRDGGRFVSKTTNVQPDTSRAPAEQPAADQPEPASSLLPLPPSHSGSNTSRVRVRHPDCGAIARRVWEHASRCAVDLQQRNVNVPSWPFQHASSHSGWIALLDRVEELLVDSTAAQAEAVAMNRVNVASAKAAKDGDGQRFTSNGMFSKNSFDAFAPLDPAEFAKKPARAGPRKAGELIGSASPRNDHPEGERLIPINEIPVPR